jgi:hypothetical protein
MPFLLSRSWSVQAMMDATKYLLNDSIIIMLNVHI